jgi:hypothetical protein
MPSAPKTTTKLFRIQAMTGGINTIAEENDLIAFGSPQAGSEARDIENFAPLYRGGQSKAKIGFTQVVDTGASPVTGIYRYIKANGTNKFIVSYGNTVSTLVSTTLTPITTMTSNAYINFETATDNLIICDGVLSAKIYTGSVTSIITTPVGGIRQAVFYQNRLFIFSSTSNQSLVYYSVPNQVSGAGSGYSTQFIQCDTNDGQKITCLKRLFLPGQEFNSILLVGKERSVGVITGDGTTANPFTFNKISFDTGIPGFRGAIQYEGNIAFFTPKGVSSYITSVQNNNMLYTYISEKVRNKFLDMNQNKLDLTQAWYDWKKSRISFACTEAGFTYPNVIWHYDVRLGCWYKERWGTGYDCTASFIDINGDWYHGDSNGRLFLHDGSDKFDTAPVISFYKTPYMDFGAPQLRKRILQAAITARGDGNYAIGVGVSLDYGQRNSRFNTVPITQAAYQWGAGVWTNDPNIYQWGAAPIDTTKFWPSGHFKNMQITFQQGGADQPVDIFELDLLVEFEEFR